MAVLALILSALTLPFYPLIYGPNIDDSLHWAFNYFADGHYELARDTSFPHGPLAFLLYPLLMGNNLVVAASAHVAASFALAVVVLRHQATAGLPELILRTAVLFVLLSICDLQLLLAGLTLTTGWLNRERAGYGPLAAMAGVGVLALLIKTYAGMICALLITVETARVMARRRRMLPAFFAVGVWLGLYLAARLLMFGSASGSLDFLIAQVQLSFDNSEAVLFDNAQNWWLLTLCLVSLFIFGILLEPKGRAAFLLMLPALFAGWKHAMSRSETSHMLGFFCLVTLFTGLLLLFFTPARKLAFAAALAAPLAFLANIGVQDNNLRGLAGSFWRPASLYQFVFFSDSIKTQKEKENQYYLRAQKLPPEIREEIADQETEVYPWNFSIVGENRLNWKPRPVLNSYAAYTAWLDNRDARFFGSRQAPEFLLWEHTDPNDRGLRYESIDDRHLLNDEPMALLQMLASYRPVRSTERFRLFQKRTNPLTVSTNTISQEQACDFSRWYAVPLVDSTEILRAKVRLKKNVAGAIKSFLYKGEVFYISCELDNGKVVRHRFVSRNARHGLWISPFVALTGSGAIVKRIRIHCSNSTMMKGTFTLQYEKVSLGNGAEKLQPASFFQ